MNPQRAISRLQLGLVAITLIATMLVLSLQLRGFPQEAGNLGQTEPLTIAEKTPIIKASNLEATTAATEISPEPSDASVGNPTNSSPLDRLVAQALAAQDAKSSVQSLASIADEASARNHLELIGAICRGAARMRSSAIERDTIEALSQKKFVEFEKIYCGDAKALNDQIAGVLAGYTSIRLSERESLIETLFASEKTEATANAIINEILVSPDIFSSVRYAQYLNRFSHKDQPLADWGRYMQRYIKAADRSAVFQIAGELVNCPRLNACGVNQFYLGYLCLNRQNCIPGEDLLAYRRRTTSPMLYQAAEQIAAEMQARRYR